MRLTRTTEGYEYKPLGVTIYKTTLGSVHTGGSRTWWVATRNGVEALFGTLGDLRTWLRGLA